MICIKSQGDATGMNLAGLSARDYTTISYEYVLLARKRIIIIYKAARHPKSYISLDGADHLLSSAKDSEYAGTLIAGWADRYL